MANSRPGTLLRGEAFQEALARLGDDIAAGVGDPLALLGIRRRGVPLAARLRAHLLALGREDLPSGELDLNLYRDDVHDRGIPEVGETRIPFPLEERHLVLVDDVLFTGRTVRAALTALSYFGRPRSVRLAVLVDRGGRELPIAPDFTGITVTAAPGQMVRVRVEEEDGEDRVVTLPSGNAEGR